MLIVISPAKKLDFENPTKVKKHTIPCLLRHSEELMEICRTLTPAEIGSLMKVSDKIAGLNAARFGNWQVEFNLDNAKQALFAFRGDVYTGIDADTLTASGLNRAQAHLRILSGLYGVVRPLDLIQAYRLEMGTRLTNRRGSNLYQFWGDIITEQLQQALVEQGDKIMINLASNEYFKAVNVDKLSARIITPVFKDWKNGQYKIISFYAKKARGMMTRYLIDNNIKTDKNITDFDSAGYYYCQAQSSINSPVFLRDNTQ